MKNIIFLFAFLSGSITFITAQDFHLPVTTTSETATAAYYKASEAASNVNFEVANQQLNVALEADPNFFMAYVLKIYYSGGEERVELIGKALAIDASSFNEAEKIVRQQLVIWDKNPEAKIGDNMKKLVAAYSNTPEAYQWASLHAAFTDGDMDTSLKNAQKLAELRPTFAPNYNVLGYVYVSKKQMDNAKAAFERYIELAPKEANAYDSMGEYYMMVKDYVNSAKYYDKAATLGLESSKARAEKARAAIE